MRSASKEEAESQKPSRLHYCSWKSKECWIAGILVVILVVFSVCYIERRPHRAANAGLVKVNVDVGDKIQKRVISVATRHLTDKPRGDTRAYQHAVLPNGLQVLNIQDNNTLKVSFAMAVRAGSFDDPESLPGLAHFCEHMLFLGTKAYPEPSGFDDFMAKSGGGDNAYTAQEVTVYYGEVSHAAREEVMSRFADFFRAPLFDKRFVSKEVHAIDSEHAKNEQSPAFRIMQALSSLADPRSPVGRFHTGNADTLYNIPHKDGLDPVESLKVYFRDNYCPEQMRLVTFGSSSLVEQLTTASKDFGNIPKGNKACANRKHSFATPDPWPTLRLQKWMIVEGTQPQAQLWLHFPMPDLTGEYMAQPLEYIDYVIGYQGENSLGRVLSDNLGLATSSQLMFDMSTAGTSVYYVATLTASGRKHLDLVLDVFYAYLARLQVNGVDGDLYTTIADVMKLKWDWNEPASPEDTASDLAERMTRLSAEHLLSGDTRIDRPNPKLVASLLKRLRPDNMNAAYVDPNATVAGLFGAQQVQTLPYYGVKYTVGQFSDRLPGDAQRWVNWLDGHTTEAALEGELARQVRKAGIAYMSTPLGVPPKPIKDVPKDINLDNMKAKKAATNSDQIDVELFGPRPAQLAALIETGATAKGGNTLGKAGTPEVWYRSGWVTTSPKVTIQLDMRPLRSDTEPEFSALDEVRLGIYSRLLREEMAPKMVDLTATGVSYDISVSPNGLSFTFGGFAPVLPRLVNTVLEEFNRFNKDATLTSPSRFARIAEELREELGTFTEMPVQYAVQDRKLLLTHGDHSNKESLAVLGSVTLESAAKSASELLLSRPLQLTALAMGNLNEHEAKSVVEKVWGGIQIPDWLTLTQGSGEIERVTKVVKPAHPVEVRMKNPRPADPNDAIVVSLLWGVSTVESRVTLGLLGQILSTLAYNELRTSRQLGYVVSAGAAIASNVHYISVVVQGNVLRADEVEALIELVLVDMMPKRLKEMSQDEFSSFVDSFEQELLQPPMAPGEEIGQFWGPVKQGGHCFQLRGEILKYLNSSALSREHLAEVWNNLVQPAHGVRKKVAVKYFANEVPDKPSPEETRKIMEQQGVPAAAIERLLKEKRLTRFFDRADSSMRQKLVEAGGYYPQDLRCRLDDKPQGAAAESLARRRRKNDKQAFLSAAA
mmetsp:Transcript_53193/g.151582  ORF Transcript_53193/g.151582 Transcript_53193/m.151582 type:complete len:1166 (-) Transcript_53193:77-3574(-)